MQSQCATRPINTYDKILKFHFSFLPLYIYMLLHVVQIHYYHIEKQNGSYQQDRRLEESFDIDTQYFSNHQHNGQGMVHGGLHEYLVHNMSVHLESHVPNQT